MLMAVESPVSGEEEGGWIQELGSSVLAEGQGWELLNLVRFNES